MENALNQIKNKKYDQDLKARGIPEENIHHYGFAFEGEKRADQKGYVIQMRQCKDPENLHRRLKNNRTGAGDWQDAQ